MFKRYQIFWRFIFLIVDVLILNISMSVAYNAVMLDKHYSIFINGFGTYQMLFTLVWLMLSYWRNFYNSPLRFISTTRDIISLVGMHVFIILIYVFLKKYVHFSRTYLIIFYACFFTLTLLSRYSTIILHYYLGFFRDYERKVIILGRTRVSQKLGNRYSSKDSGYKFEGFYEDIEVPKNDAHKESFEYISNLIDYAEKNNIQEVFIGFIPKFNGQIRQLIEKAESAFIRLKFIPDFSSVFISNIKITIENEVPIINIRKEPLEDMKNRFQKKVFDLVFSFFVIVLLLSWLIPIIAIIIKLTSKGPVFFKQNRAGIDNKPFAIYKFRTMRVVEADAEFKQAQKDDPRITKIGGFLRKTSLDEIPQFINVFLGDMSVVGPRPHPLKLNDDYKDVINNYMLRHFLKPGITGLAQVNGCRGETKDSAMMQKRIEYDVWYLENWSFLLDVKIIIRTLVNAVKGDEQAY